MRPKFDANHDTEERCRDTNPWRLVVTREHFLCAGMSLISNQDNFENRIFFIFSVPKKSEGSWVNVDSEGVVAVAAA